MYSNYLAHWITYNTINIWFPFWINDHFFKILEKFLPTFIILILIPVVYFFIKPIKIYTNTNLFYYKIDKNRYSIEVKVKNKVHTKIIFDFNINYLII